MLNLAGYFLGYLGVDLSSPVASLDRADCRILMRLNAGSEEPKPALRNRIDKLRKSGFVEDKGIGGVAITLRGQLELARWRFRKLPKNKIVVLGPRPSANPFSKFFKSS